MFTNELGRLIRMPLTIIMGVIILVLVGLSSLFYSPQIITQENVWKEKSSNEIYNEFISNPNYLDSYNKMIEESVSILNYFSVLNGRTTETTISLNSVFEKYDVLKKEIPNGDSATLYKKYLDFKKSLQIFKSALLNFDVINDIPYINFINVRSTEYVNSLDALSQLITQCDVYDNRFEDKAEASNALCNYYNENKLRQKLDDLNLSAMGFLDITIESMVDKIIKAYNDYITYMDTLPNASAFQNGSIANPKRNNLQELVYGSNSFSKLLEYMVDSPYLSIYSNKQLIVQLQNDLDQTYKAVNIPAENRNMYSSHRSAVMSLKTINLIESLKAFKNNYVLILPNQEVVEEIGELINNNVLESKNDLYNKITAMQDSSSSSTIIEYVNNYEDLANMSYKLVIYESVLSTFSVYDSTKTTEFYGENLEDFNEYEYRTLSTLYKYLIKNKEYPSNYSYPYQFNFANNEKSALDFTVFGVRIALILTIVAMAIFSILLLPREWETMTLRLTLSKPISRRGVFFGKLFAVFLIGIMYLTFSIIFLLTISSIIGYSFINTTIISVVNAKHVIKIAPIVNILLIFLCGILELLFATSLSFMISSFFRKSYLATITNTLSIALLYLLNWITNSNIWCSFLPNTNIDFYKYFMVSPHASNNLFTQLFSPAVVSNMNMGLSFLVYIGYLGIFYLISNAVLKCRDF